MKRKAASTINTLIREAEPKRIKTIQYGPKRTILQNLEKEKLTRQNNDKMEIDPSTPTNTDVKKTVDDICESLRRLGPVTSHGNNCTFNINFNLK